VLASPSRIAQPLLAPALGWICAAPATGDAPLPSFRGRYRRPGVCFRKARSEPGRLTASSSSSSRRIACTRFCWPRSAPPDLACACVSKPGKPGGGGGGHSCCLLALCGWSVAADSALLFPRCFDEEGGHGTSPQRAALSTPLARVACPGLASPQPACHAIRLPECPTAATQVQEWALATGGCFSVVREGSARHEFVRSPPQFDSYRAGLLYSCPAALGSMFVPAAIGKSVVGMRALHYQALRVHHGTQMTVRRAGSSTSREGSLRTA
jgi:hypothetical protein